MKEMVGGCCVCSDDRGWTENPLVYCDGQGCNVAVHQACYGIVSVPTGNWYCRRCESPDSSKVRCELCPSADGALKPTDSGKWAHVVCALYIPEVRFGNVTTMEPIVLHQVPQERFNKACYICQEEGAKRGDATMGACMQCNRSGCRQVFHVTCAQQHGLLCEEAGHYQDNVKYCGYCHHHYNRIVSTTASTKKGSNVKVIPPYRPKPASSRDELKDTDEPQDHATKRKLSGNKEEEVEKASPAEVPAPVEMKPVPVETKPPPVGAKKRKPDLSVQSRSGTPTNAQNSPSQSPRPTTPAAPSQTAPTKSSTPPTTNGSAGVSKVGSIVVQVPLEATQLGVTSASADGSDSPTRQSPPLTNPPAKRSRSESSDKSEKRRSRRSGDSSNTRSHRKSPTRIKSSPEPRPSSAGSSSDTNRPSSTKPVIKEEKDNKLLEMNGVAPHMLGNALNPGSSMADTLSQEVQAHSVYTRTGNNQFQGPHFPRPTPVRGPGSTGTAAGGGGGTLNWDSSGPNNVHIQSLEQLLERQWEQGSQFLMEQAHHFDIASLLSCLHQLRQENAQLADHVNTLVARRDHLLAVNARLAIPLVPAGGSGSSHASGSSGGSIRAGSSTASTTVASAVLTNSVSNIVENGLATPQEQYRAANIHRAGLEPTNSSGSGGGGGGGGGLTRTYGNSGNQSSVVMRASSTPHHGAATSHIGGSTPLHVGGPPHHAGTTPHIGGSTPHHGGTTPHHGGAMHGHMAHHSHHGVHSGLPAQPVHNHSAQAQPAPDRARTSSFTSGSYSAGPSQGSNQPLTSQASHQPVVMGTGRNRDDSNKTS